MTCADVFVLTIHYAFGKHENSVEEENRHSLGIYTIQTEWIGRRYGNTFVSIRPGRGTVNKIPLNYSAG